MRRGSSVLPAAQYTDPETGLQYLRARYYDPGSGQFLSADPLAAKTRDRYGYAARSPLNFRDPSGKDLGDLWDDTGGQVASAISDHSDGITQGLEVIGETALVVGAGACIVATAGGCTVVVGAAVAGAGVMASDAIAGDGLNPTHWAIGAVAGGLGGGAGAFCGAICGGAITGALTDAGIQKADGCNFNPWQSVAAAGTGGFFGGLGEVPGMGAGESAASRAFSDLFGVFTGFDPARFISPIISDHPGIG